MIPGFGAVTPLLAGIGILVLGGGALNTLIPLLMQQDGLPTWATGVVMASFFAGQFAGPFSCRRIIGSIGHIRTFATFVSLASVTVLAHPFVEGIIAWAALRFAYGFCIICIYVVVESWLNARSTNEVRGRVLSIYVILIFLMQGLGQYLVNIPDPTGTFLFVIISALISLAAVPVLVSKSEQPDIPETSALSFKKLYRASPLGTIGIVLSGVIVGTILSLGPVYANDIGLSVSEISMFMSAVFIGGLFLQWPAGAISDKFGRRPVLLVLGIGVAAASILLAILPVGTAPWIPIGLFGCFGAFYFVIYPMCIAITNDRLEPADLVPASAGLLILNNVGSATGPLIAGAIASLFGSFAIFGFCALAGGGVVLVALWRTTQRPAVIPSDGDSFQPVPLTTPVAAELDPRGETTD